MTSSEDNPMKRIIRDRRLTPEEAEKYRRIRDQTAAELPDLVQQYRAAMGTRASGHGSVAIPSVSVRYAHDGRSAAADALGMRPMQARVWLHRGERYLLIKSPPASGKSRALMFVALDKLKHQGMRQVIITVPEKTIGASFHDEPLSKFGFWADWKVEPRWNLCDAPGGDNGSKVEAVRKFLASADRILVCTHATFRFAFDKFGAESFDDRLIAVDEFHHVSSSEDSRLGEFMRALIERDKVHIVAMTGSYFRGDAAAVLDPDDEEKFRTVTYTYYEQLNGYKYLKELDIGYYFYTGSYLERREGKKSIFDVLNPDEKTIVHIPNVNARESTRDKINEANAILSGLGEWQGADPATGFQLVKAPSGRILRVADLVDDETKREKVAASLRDSSQKNNRDHVDVIIALGMAKEGFDWIWCEHALTVGYRSSLTEIVQIIGRATRDAPGKARARFTNLIAEPDASEESVVEAVNDTLKAIAASLLMEQVLAPRFEFKPKDPTSGPQPGFDYGPEGYRPGKENVGVNPETGSVQMEIRGLMMPKSEEAQRICREDLNELVTAFVQDERTVQIGMFDKETPPQEVTQVRMGKIVKDRYPKLSEEDQEAVRQQAVAAINFVQAGKKALADAIEAGEEVSKNTALLDGIRRFAMSVRELNIDLIDAINPFGAAYAIMAKSLGEARLRAIADVIAAKKFAIPPEDARAYAVRAVQWKKERGRAPSLTSPDAWEKKLAEGAQAYMRYAKEGRYDQRA